MSVDIDHIQKPTFDYTELDVETGQSLQTRANRIFATVGSAYTEVGRELKEARDELANHRNGLFEKWFTSLGLKKKTVYNLINRYEYIVQNLHDIQSLEELPLSLTYEISKPSAPEELQKAVLDGDVRTHKEYKEMEAQLKESEERIEILQGALEAELNKPTPTPQVIEKRVTPPEVIERLVKQEKELVELRPKLEQLTKERDLLERKSKLNEREAKEYAALKDQLKTLNEQKNELSRQIESATVLSGLVVEIDHLLKTKLAPIKYSRAMERLDSEVALENLRDIINSVESWVSDMKSYLPEGDYIDVEVIS